VHEFSIAQSLVDAAVTEARLHGASRVTKLSCRIGALRQVDDWLIREAFAIAREGTICATCELAVETTYMQAMCPACNVRFAVRNWEWRCPTCMANGEEPAGGDELELTSVELELPDGDNRSPERVRAQ
jgi:hydrogenase nickel incorporation protein HypA/HybF